MNARFWLLIAGFVAGLGCAGTHPNDGAADIGIDVGGVDVAGSGGAGGSSATGSGGSSGSGGGGGSSGASVVDGSVPGVDSSVLEPSCPSVTVQLTPLYTPQKTNCEPLGGVYVAGGIEVTFDSGGSGVQTTSIHVANQRIEIETVRHGCTFNLTLLIFTTTGLGEYLQEEISGDSLRIEATNRVTGIVEIIRYDESQEVACSGVYDATFTPVQWFNAGASP